MDKRKYDGRKHEWLKNTKRFIWLFIFVFMFFRFVIGFSFVKGVSMEPTLKTGNFVVYNRLSENYNRGDVVSVRVPSGEYYVKRVIATGGETIDIKDGKVFINGKPIQEDYLACETHPQGDMVSYPYTLEANQVFIMGDNRVRSTDSRDFGAVSVRQVKGKIYFVD